MKLEMQMQNDALYKIGSKIFLVSTSGYDMDDLKNNIRFETVTTMLSNHGVKTLKSEDECIDHFLDDCQNLMGNAYTDQIEYYSTRG